MSTSKRYLTNDALAHRAALRFESSAGREAEREPRMTTDAGTGTGRLRGMDRALMVTQCYHPELIGSGPYCTDLAEWLRDRGVAVEVLTSRPQYPRAAAFPDYTNGSHDREIVADVPVLRLKTRPRRGTTAWERICSETSFLLGGVRALLAGAVVRRTTVIAFCPSILAALLGWLATRRGGRSVAVVHDIQSGLAGGLALVTKAPALRFLRFAERVILNRADLVIVLSEEMRQELLKIGIRRPIEVLPNWIDGTKIRPLPRPEGAPPTVLYSGNLGRKQGLLQVLDMAARLAQDMPEARIVIRGDGWERERLVAEAQRRGLVNVVFEALRPAAALCEALAEGDVHLVPLDPQAVNFAVPSKIFTTMAAGRPFVCTAQPGSPLWRLQQEAGAFVCVPPNDSAAFAAAVGALLDDPARRAELAERGRRYVLDHAAREDILAAYGRVLAG